MSLESIEKMIYANGTFPDIETVHANFEALLTMATEKTENIDDLLLGIIRVLDQESQVGEVDIAVLQRVADWVMANWPAGDADLSERRQRMMTVLVNVPTVASVQSLEFLKQKRAQATDPEEIRALDGSIGEWFD